MAKRVARAPGSPPRGGSAWSTVQSPWWPAPGRGPARAPPAQPSLEAHESAAAGCAATTFPVFFLNSSGGGRSAAPSPRLSGNTPPHSPRCACPLLSSLITKRFRGATACPRPLPRPSPQPLPQPPRRLAVALPPRSPAPLALKPSRGASVTVGLLSVCARGAAENPAWSARRPPAARGRADSGAPAAPGAHARGRAPAPRGPRSAPPSRCGSPSPRLPAPHGLHQQLLPGRFRQRARRAARTRLFRSRATFSEGLGFRVFEASFLRV